MDQSGTRIQNLDQDKVYNLITIFPHYHGGQFYILVEETGVPGIIIKFMIYQGNQCLSPTKVVSCGFSLIRRCTCFWYTHISHKFIDSPIKGPQGAYTYTIYEQVLSLTCSRFIDLFGNSSFLHQYIKLTAMIMRKYSYKVVHLYGCIKSKYTSEWVRIHNSQL
jgi:hypothetical protein